MHSTTLACNLQGSFEMQQQPPILKLTFIPFWGKRKAIYTLTKEREEETEIEEREERTERGET